MRRLQSVEPLYFQVQKVKASSDSGTWSASLRVVGTHDSEPLPLPNINPRRRQLPSYNPSSFKRDQTARMRLHSLTVGFWAMQALRTILTPDCVVTYTINMLQAAVVVA